MSNEPKHDNIDYEALGRAIEQEVRATVSTLADTMQSVARSVGQTVRDNAAEGRQRFSTMMQDEVGRTQGNPYAEDGRVKPTYTTMYQQRILNQKPPKQQRRRMVNYAKKAKGALSESGSFVFVACILFAVTIFADAGVVPAIVGAFFLGGSAFSWFKGKRFQRFALYMNVMGTRSYCTVAELAAASGKSERAVHTDLQTHLTNGTLEGLYLAPDGSRLFSSETAYNLYLAQKQAAPAHKAAPAPAAQKQPEPQPAACLTVLDECRAFIAELHRQNELIDDAAVTEQVSKIEKHMELITAWLQKHPGREDRVRRFTSYYLPTIIKLLETYNDVDPHADNASTVAVNIQHDIVGILYSINTAFDTLENGLMEDTALDVSAEISAMETMLAQDGLAKSDF